MAEFKLDCWSAEVLVGSWSTAVLVGSWSAEVRVEPLEERYVILDKPVRLDEL